MTGQLRTWIPVCRLDQLRPERGAPVLLDGMQLALFRTSTGQVYAIAAKDPFSDANVLARGLLGSAGDQLYVASPMYKQRFCLRTGQCLDDPEVRVAAYATRVVDGVVQVHRSVGVPVS